MNHGAVVHFELAGDRATQAFYENAFGWKFQAIPQLDYSVIHTVETDRKGFPKLRGAINGGMIMGNASNVGGPCPVVAVNDIKKACEEVVKNGGKLLGEVKNVADMGLSIRFSDPHGNVMSLWQALEPL